jgi:ATP-binding cassette, subfamily F, member 3
VIWRKGCRKGNKVKEKRDRKSVKNKVSFILYVFIQKKPTFVPILRENKQILAMINVQNVSVFYGDRVLFDSVSFGIGERDRIGLVGKNGAGKSTMMKIIARQTPPSSGDVSKPNDATVGYLHQDMALPKGKTVIDETQTAFEEVKELEVRLHQIEHDLEVRTDYETDSYSDLIQEYGDINDRFNFLGGHTARADAEKILAGLGFKPTDMDRLTDEFSGGWQMRIELAKMLLRKPDYLLLDEPTNHLDIESIIWLEDFLKGYAGAVVLISHDKTFLDAITKRTIEIELGNVYDYKASYTRYIEMRRDRREALQSAYNNQQVQLEQMQRNIDRFRAQATKSSFAQSLIKQMDKIQRVEIDEEDNSSMKLKFQPAPRAGDIVVEGMAVEKRYGKLVVLNEVDLQIDRGDRVAFIGQNGQGKTTLSKIIAQAEEATGGILKLGHNVCVGYYAQNQAENLPMKSTLLECMEANCPWEMRTKVRNILGSFMFSGSDVDKKVSVLSGGERARLAMACMLLHPINLLILDEPTNHLDMLSKDILKRAVQEYDGTLIVVSHDRDFLTGLTNRVLEFRDTKLYEYLGDIQYFLEKRKVQDMREVGKRAVEVAAQKAAKASISEDEKRNIERKIANAERKMEQLDKEVKDIEKEMGKDGFYESKNAAATLEKYNKKKAELKAAEAEWEAAAEMM